jgi:hypothetical protein
MRHLNDSLHRKLLPWTFPSLEGKSWVLLVQWKWILSKVCSVMTRNFSSPEGIFWLLIVLWIMETTKSAHRNYQEFFFPHKEIPDCVWCNGKWAPPIIAIPHPPKTRCTDLTARTRIFKLRWQGGCQTDQSAIRCARWHASGGRQRVTAESVCLRCRWVLVFPDDAAAG